MTERTKTPELGPCAQCGRTQLALVKMHARGIMRGWLPTVGDNASWEELRKDHAPDCYWYETRGYRVFEPGTHVVSMATFNAIAMANLKEKGK